VKRGSLVWLASLAIVAIAGFFAGWLIKGGGKADFRFDVAAAPYSQADLPGARSKAGFTGFSETGGLDGSAIVAGKVTALGPDSVTLSTPSGANTIRLTAEQKLRMLQPFTGQIVVGATVVVSVKPGAGEAQALLVVLDP
jgi:hypothetical protein